jgi:nucleotide-binding universal stress UspA family protein
MYQRILVAIDDSPTAERALHEALDLAQVVGGRVLIVTVVDLVPLTWEGAFADPTLIWDALTQEAEKLLQKRTADLHTNVEIETRLLKNNASEQRIPEVIEAEAESWQADLIVIGTHGRRGINRILLGSVAEGLARIARKPVLLIRGK